MEGDKRGLTDYNGEMRRGGRGAASYRMSASKDPGAADMGLYGDKVHVFDLIAAFIWSQGDGRDATDKYIKY